MKNPIQALYPPNPLNWAKLLPCILLVVMGCSRTLITPNYKAKNNPPAQAPRDLRYSAPAALYLYNDFDPQSSPSISSNRPQVKGEVEEFTIQPELHARTGLEFDRHSGVISGTATKSSPLTAYLVTAKNSEGLARTTLHLRTAAGFVVNDLSNATLSFLGPQACTFDFNCTLTAALEWHRLWPDKERVILAPRESLEALLPSEVPENLELIELNGDPS